MIEEKIAKVLMEFLASNTDGGGRGGEFKVKDLVEELTTLIQQERESAVREFVGWIQGQAHEYKAAVHMPVNQAHIQVREVYELLNQFLQGQNK